MGTTAQAISGDFVLGKLENKFLKLASSSEAPTGARIYTREELSSLPKEELEEMYATIAGVEVKRFKTQELALENLWYQAEKKLQVSGSEADPAAADAATVAVPKEGKKYARKTVNRYILQITADADKMIKELAPQARECVGIMIDLGKELGRFEFEEAELKAKVEACGERFGTRQEPWRIFQYYRSKLNAKGLLKVA